MHDAIRKHTQNIKKFHDNKIRRYYKFIPLIGLILLLMLFSSQKNQPDSTPIVKQSFVERLSDSWYDVSNSFKFDGLIDVLITTILLITIWTGYKYWLLRLRYIRNNANLLQNIIIVIMLFIFVDRHIKLDSFLGQYIDWILFLIFLYIILAGSWYLAKTIDRIDLTSDLYCWGLRIIATIVIFIGVNLFFSSAFVLTFSNSKLVFDNIYWILSICLILLGAFMGFRSVRRYPMIKIW
ncbi:MAG: hypothetical protein Q7J54_03145 [Candidatus Woesearchaeota archaeon]|nr:hypothetical protein [Candidatus Woesearchaeota archaeon]